jgi:N-acetylglucosamine kinase-like BadF-type ATPase
MLFAGFDGGGTKCEGVVVDATGTERARATGGSTNQNSVGWETALEHFAAVAAELRRALGPGATLGGAWLGMAGADREPERLRWSEAASRALEVSPQRVRVSNDAVTALASGTGGHLCGVAVIAGTGTIAVAMAGADGPIARAQGWGPLLGDEGSGHAVGLAVLRAVMRSHDGADPPTVMTGPVLEAAGCAAAPELVAWAYGEAGAAQWARVAALAPCAEQAAAAGDAAAGAALDRAAAALAEAVRGCASRCVGLPVPVPVVFAGGLLRKGAPVAERLQRLLHDVQVLYPTVSAAHAAATIAWREFG